MNDSVRMVGCRMDPTRTGQRILSLDEDREASRNLKYRWTAERWIILAVQMGNISLSSLWSALRDNEILAEVLPIVETLFSLPERDTLETFLGLCRSF